MARNLSILSLVKFARHVNVLKVDRQINGLGGLICLAQ